MSPTATEYFATGAAIQFTISQAYPRRQRRRQRQQQATRILCGTKAVTRLTLSHTGADKIQKENNRQGKISDARLPLYIYIYWDVFLRRRSQRRHLQARNPAGKEPRRPGASVNGRNIFTRVNRSLVLCRHQRPDAFLTGQCFVYAPSPTFNRGATLLLAWMSRRQDTTQPSLSKIKRETLAIARVRTYLPLKIDPTRTGSKTRSSRSTPNSISPTNLAVEPPQAVFLFYTHGHGAWSQP